MRRDFTVNAMALRLPDLDVRRPVRRASTDLDAGLLRTPSPPEVSFGDDPLRMMRAARFVAQLGFDVGPRGARRDDARWRPRSRSCRPSGCATSWASCCWRRTRGPGSSCWSTAGWPTTCCPSSPRLQLEVDEHHRHKDVYEHSLTVLEQAIDLEGPPGGPRVGARARPRAAPGRAAARRRQAGDPPVRGRRRCLLPPPRGGRAPSSSPSGSRRCGSTRRRPRRWPGWSSCTCASTATATGAWTDSAVRRYVTDAGPLLPRLHRLTRADCTTRNVRKARRLAATYDDLEARIEVLLEQEELAAVRPELDGNEIAASARHRARARARARLQAPARRAPRRGAAGQGPGA